jgi:hypothetical protein
MWGWVGAQLFFLFGDSLSVYVKTVLLLDRPRHSQDNMGRFQSTSDEMILYFPKVKDAPTEFRPLKLTFFRDEFIFKPITDHYESEDEG